MADKIYRTRKNLHYCERNNIRFNGLKLGRPPKDKSVYSNRSDLRSRSQGNEPQLKVNSEKARDAMVLAV